MASARPREVLRDVVAGQRAGVLICGEGACVTTPSAGIGAAPEGTPETT